MAEETTQSPQEAQNPQVQAQAPGPISLTRRQRRYMLKQQGVLKYLSKLPFLGEVRTRLRLENLENGRKIHQQHVDANEKANAERLEKILEGYTYTNEEGDSVSVPGLKDKWTTQGYNASELSMLEEAWALGVVKNKETYREDKKKRLALQKEAKASRAARQK